MVMAVIGILSSLAVPHLERAKEMAQVAKAIADVRVLESEVFDFFNFHEFYPNSLEEIGRSGYLDPWGNPYEFLNLVGHKKGKVETEGGDVKGRKNKFLKPINDDFDLFSMGLDGEYKEDLNKKESRDDVIRAMNGAYVGLASEF